MLNGYKKEGNMDKPVNLHDAVHRDCSVERGRRDVVNSVLLESNNNLADSGIWHRLGRTRPCMKEGEKQERGEGAMK